MRTGRTSKREKFKERIYLDKANPNLLHDEIRVFDNALTRRGPWTRSIRATLIRGPRWTESSCIETNLMVAIGRESYFMSGDGMLMLVRKKQPPPDLRYFKQSRK